MPRTQRTNRVSEYWDFDNIGDVEKLVGTFWLDSKDQAREIVEVADLRRIGKTVSANIYWKRPGGKVRLQPSWYPYFKEWLEKATEIDEAQAEAWIIRNAERGRPKRKKKS